MASSCEYSMAENCLVVGMDSHQEVTEPVVFSPLLESYTVGRTCTKWREVGSFNLFEPWGASSRVTRVGVSLSLISEPSTSILLPANSEQVNSTLPS